MLKRQTLGLLFKMEVRAITEGNSHPQNEFLVLFHFKKRVLLLPDFLIV